MSCSERVFSAVICLQIQGFDWKNCGSPDVPAVLQSLTVSPDPIAIPGDLAASASGSTTVELGAPLSVSICPAAPTNPNPPGTRTNTYEVIVSAQTIREEKMTELLLLVLFLIVLLGR